ncbi:MAG: FAD-binding oxidoreductase, partial [Aeromicrobium sp.]
MNTALVLADLQERLPAHSLFTDPALMESYRTDRAMFCEAGVPLAVVRAQSTAEVSATMEIATKHGVPVVPQGARSGLSGAANAIDGCIVISLEAMDQVVRIDTANRYVVTQPGVFNAVLARAVAEHGLFYPPDPSSKEFCTIGG